MKKGPTEKQIEQFKAQRKKDIRYLIECAGLFWDFGHRGDAAACLNRIPLMRRLAVAGPSAL